MWGVDYAGKTEEEDLMGCVRQWYAVCEITELLKLEISVFFRYIDLFNHTQLHTDTQQLEHLLKINNLNLSHNLSINNPRVHPDIP